MMLLMLQSSSLCLPCLVTIVTRWAEMTSLGQDSSECQRYQFLERMVRCCGCTIMWHTCDLCGHVTYEVMWHVCMWFYIFVKFNVIAFMKWSISPVCCQGMGNTGYSSIVCNEVIHFGHLCRLSTDIWSSFCEHLWLPSWVLQPPRQVRVPQHGKGTSCRTVCVCCVLCISSVIYVYLHALHFL